MGNMAHMRAEEGRAMSNDLAANCAAIAVELDQIDRRRRKWRPATGPGWASG